MGNAAYDFDYFMPQPQKQQQAPKLRQVQGGRKAKSARLKQLQSTVKVLVTAVVLVVLVCSVIHTQTNVAELQSQIDSKKNELIESEAYYAYLNFELETMSNTRNIEQRAKELGLTKAKNNQITYLRLDDESAIELQPSPLVQFFSDVKNGLVKLTGDVQ